MRYRRFASLALCLVIAFNTIVLPLSAFAQEAGGKVVRVGWYESAYHSTDRYGRRSGYGYEYLQRVATYTGWNYEFVEGSWPDLLEMLLAGEIDLLTDVSYTEERAERILFSAEAMGFEIYHAFISSSNTEITPDDLTTFNGKRVAVNKNSILEKLLADWSEANGVTPEVIELADRSPEILDMLSRGEIDVLVTADAYMARDDVVSVCNIGSADFYFGINMARPDLKEEIDSAMKRIFDDDSGFNQRLADKYLSTHNILSFLTPAEVEWLDGRGAIRVGYREDFLPFCGVDPSTGALGGALSDFLLFAENCEKNASMTFEAKPFTTMNEAIEALKNGEIDCLFPSSLSSYDGEQLGLVITDALISAEMYAAVRTADHLGVSGDREMTVAIISGHRNYTAFVMDNFPGWNIKYFKDAESCFRAVYTGEADLTLVNNYRLNRISEFCEKYKLSTLTTGAAIDISFAVAKGNDCLYSILNKVCRLMPDSAVNSSLSAYSFNEEKVTFGDFIKDNLAVFVAFAAAIIILILVLLLMNVRSSLKASEGTRIISETERDQLTGLYNKSFFTIYAYRLFREHPDRKMDAVVVNVERLHALNRINGREFGDGVLRALGTEIGAFLSETEGIAGRMEGDHFNIYCAHLEDHRPLLDLLQARMHTVSGNADVLLRMGVMPWQEGMTPNQMFERAWSACSVARGNYKTRLVIYDDEFKRREQLEQRLQNDLGRALSEHELVVYYQPKYDIRNDEPMLASAEALVRWNHPELGLIPPREFITLFEKSGQISAVDGYVWTEAARQIAKWREEYGWTLPVSVNLSRVDIFDPHLAEKLDAIVGGFSLSRKDLKLEVTESAYTENADQLISVIGKLREKGYEIEMDDFGSGYSSLNMLSSMPIDVLKMDIEFIRSIDRDEKNMRLVKLILDIADYLDVLVVAEGVETANQLELLKKAGCDLVQGYYFSPPLPADQFETEVLAKA